MKQIEERWVRVRGQDYTVQEVSLPDALLHAHEYRDLAGELPTQDAAMLRLLLAVLHTVFSRVDENGTPAPFEETDDALIRWEGLYRLGHFPEAPIRAYLEQWRDRFWLFHPERPFWQVPEEQQQAAAVLILCGRRKRGIDLCPGGPLAAECEWLR